MAMKKKATKKSAKPMRAKTAKKAPAKAKAKSKAKTKAKPKAMPIPKGFRTLTPYLIVRGAADALAFYAKAFGAKETLRMNMPDGGIAHAEMRIGDSMFMLSEENPQWGSRSPETLGGSATHVMIYVKDCDAFAARALAAGCSIDMPIATQFWGDRYGKVKDPYGHVWSIGTHVEDVGKKELQKRSEAAMKQMVSPEQ